MKYYIYTLNDPDTKEVRYVGKTNNISKRYSAHLNDKNKSHKVSWIKSLINNDKLPLITIIASFDCEKECYKAEIQYIKQFTNLTNLRSGGKGFYRKEVLGSNNKNSKINEDIVLLIKDDLLFTDLTIKEISEKQNVSTAIINNIASAKAWSHITEFTGNESWIRGNSIKNRRDSLIKSGVYQKQSIIVEQYDLNNNFIRTFNSITEASLISKENRSSITQCINNKQTKTKNYIWKKKHK